MRTDVQVMARTPDRTTRYVVDGKVVATGVVAVGDAAACTSPADGRGTALAAMQAVVLRDVLREVSPVDTVELAHRWHDRVGNVVHPFVADTLGQARHRHAEVVAQVAGHRYATDDAAWQFGQALRRAAGHDPELLRAMMSVAAVFERAATFARRREVVRRLDVLGDLPGLPGPTRAELVATIGAERAA